MNEIRVNISRRSKKDPTELWLVSHDLSKTFDRFKPKQTEGANMKTESLEVPSIDRTRRKELPK